MYRNYDVIVVTSNLSSHFVVNHHGEHHKGSVLALFYLEFRGFIEFNLPVTLSTDRFLKKNLPNLKVFAVVLPHQ